MPLYYFIAGIIFIAFAIPILDLILQVFTNLNTWLASYIQSKINKLNPQYEAKQSLIGFQVQDQEEYDDEDDYEE